MAIASVVMIFFRFKRRKAAASAPIDIQDRSPAVDMPQKAEHLPTLRDINPLRHDIAEPLEHDVERAAQYDEYRECMPTLPEVDPLRYDDPC